MHSSKAKFLKLALSSIVLAFFVVLLSVSDIFPNKIIPDVEAIEITTANFDTCFMTDSLSGNFTKSGGTSCYIKKTTGLAASSTDLSNNKGDLILSNNAEIIINDGAELIVAPGAEIKFLTGGKITLQTGGRPNSGISRGYLCAPDNDQDGYINPAFTDFTKVLSTVPLATPCAAGYTEKGKLKSTTVFDCDDNSASATNVCCASGYRDYDKDGYGLKSDVSACYAPSASYNVVANNYDCDDSVFGIKNLLVNYPTCGTGSCQKTGSETCTNGVTVIVPCVLSTALCCDASGNPKAAQTAVGTCQKCNGTSDLPVNQLSSEDLGNQCATGAAGTATSCQGLNCSGAGNYCGYVASGTTCRANAGGVGCDSAETCNGSAYTCPIDSFLSNSTICTTASGASGACQLSGFKCSGTANTCTTAYTVNAASTGLIWNGSAWVVASCTLNKGYSAYSCSAATTQRGAYGCNTSGGSDATTPQVTNCNSTLCTTATTSESGSVCVAGSATCSNQCADTIDNDGDGYKDLQDTGCGGGGQCTVGDCCDIPNGRFLAANTVIGTCGKCTGTSNTSVNQLASEDLGAQCATGAAGSATSCRGLNCSGTARTCGVLASGTTCRASGGIPASATVTCDSAETCNGVAETCPIDSFLSNATICNTANAVNGSCQLSGLKCSGTANTCTTAYTVNSTAVGNIWNASAWTAATCALSRSHGAAYTCSGATIIQSIYGCNTSGANDLTTAKATCSSGTTYPGATAWTSTTCSKAPGGEGSSVCVTGNASCTNLCADGLDNDGDTLVDAADPDCGAVCTSGDCCDIATGQFKPAGTCIGLCGKCTGAATGVLTSNSVDQTSLEDCASQCATGALGSATSCQSNNCSGAGRSCGVLASTTICDYGAYTPYAGASGACTLTSYRNIYKCGISSCSATVAGYDYRANQNASTVGNIWNGSVWVVASCSLNSGYSAYYCTSGFATQREAYGCDTDGTTNNSVSQATCNSTTCSSSTESASVCVAGSATCVAQCADTSDNDGDRFIDGKDTGCTGGYGQCLGGDCCTAAGQIMAINTVIGTCGKCTGALTDVPNLLSNSVNQTSGEDYGGQCATGALGSATSCQSNTCSGTSRACGALANTTICNYGTFGAYGNAAGSCSAVRYRDVFKCGTGTGVCSGTATAPQDSETQYATTSGYVWTGSAWAAPSVSNYCGGTLSGYLCSNQQIYRSYNGCALGSNTCNVARSTNNDLCTGAENNMCVTGTGTCVDKCLLTYRPADNDGDGYNDYQDSDCVGGVGQCKTGSGPCCDESNGSFKNTSTLCSTATCANATATSGQCRTSYMTQNCSGTSASCTGTTGTAYCNAPTNNNIWNGTSWVVSNGSLYCGVGSYNACSGLYPTRFAYGCNTSGTCNTTITNGYVVSPTGASCADTSKVCSNGICVQCTSVAQCPADSWAAPYSCNGNWRTGTKTTNSCTSNVCGSTTAVQNMTDCSLTSQVCSGGACTSYCPASTVSGYSVPQLNYGASTTVTKAACYRSVGGSYTATATCNSGTVGITSQTGPNCFTGYQYVFGTWYQSTYGCYDVCVLSTCSAGTVSGYSYAQMSHAQVLAPVKSIANGSCTGSIKCGDGTVVLQSENCTCNFGYDWTGSACVDCVNDSGCATGYYCSLSGSPFSWCDTTAYNTCHLKCWNLTQTVDSHTILEGNVNAQGCGTSVYNDDPFCSGAPLCGNYCASGGTYGISWGSASSGDSCYKYNGLGLRYWVTRNNYKCWQNQTSKIYYGNACAPTNGYTTKSGTVNEYGSCVVASYCGDGNCNTNEDCSSCSYDCGICQVCGDGQCTGSENEYYCYDDCGSGGYCNYDYYCDSGGGENCTGCPEDCGACQVCGDGQCTGSETIDNCSTDCFTGTCGSGYRVSGASCVACTAGTYKLGVNTATSCNTCAAGSYSSSAASSCTACPAGYYSSAGASSCTYCSAGTYNSGTGNTACSTCPTNYYCTGGTNLTSCGSGLVSVAGSTNIGACNCVSGYYISGTSCVQCSPGYYKLGTNAATSCSYCSAGTYNTMYGMSSCTTCPANYYCTGGTNLTACAAGYISNAGSPSSAYCSLATCNSGYYRSGTSCIACAAGTYKLGTNSDTSCTTCSAGTYNLTTANSSCTTCQISYYCTGGTSRTYCGTGYTSPAGSSSSGQCTYCGSGC